MDGGEPLGKKERKRLEKAARRAARSAGPAGSGRARLEKAAVNVMLVSVLTLFAIDALPAWTAVHAQLQRAVDPLLDVTGLWQGRWNLFAPEPDKVNGAISAELTYADGSVRRWRSPDWREPGVLGRIRLFRHMEYFDGIRVSDDRPAWAALALWLARTEGPRAHDGEAPVQVELARHKTVIPPPPPGLGLLDRVDVVDLPEQRSPVLIWREPR